MSIKWRTFKDRASEDLTHVRCQVDGRRPTEDRNRSAEGHRHAPPHHPSELGSKPLGAGVGLFRPED